MIVGQNDFNSLPVGELLLLLWIRKTPRHPANIADVAIILHCVLVFILYQYGTYVVQNDGSFCHSGNQSATEPYSLAILLSEVQSIVQTSHIRSTNKCFAISFV